MSQKKALISALITGAAIFGCSSAAFAEIPGFYAGLQLGYGQQNISNPGLPVAVTSGLVAASSISNSNQKGGFGGGVNAGWQFNDYFGAELGYLYFPNSTAKASATGENILAESEVNSADATSHEQAIDLMIKGMVPFGACFGGYAKLGAAYVQNKDDLTLTSSIASATGVSTATLSGSNTENKIKPIVAVGFTYDINDAAVIDLSYTYLFGSSSSNSNNVFTNISNDTSGVPKAQLIALGFTYYFGGIGTADDT